MAQKPYHGAPPTPSLGADSTDDACLGRGDSLCPKRGRQSSLGASGAVLCWAEL